MFKYFVSMLFIAGLFISSCSAADSPKNEKIVVKSKGKPVLGVVVTRVSDEELDKLNLHGGAKIKKVMDGSEAEKIGLKEGDIIVKFNGNDIADPDDLYDLISNIEEEKKVEIVVMRDGRETNFEANLKPGEKGSAWAWSDDGNFHFNFGEFPHYFGFGPGNTKGGFLGVETQDLSDQLKKYFEVDHGVLIESVVEDSPAEKAGLKAGDVITEISGKEIEDYRDLIRTINYYDPGETVEVKYTRKGKSGTVKVELGERKKMDWHHFRSGNPDENFEIQDRIERNLDRGMRHLEENLRNMERNLKKVDLNIAII